MRLDRRGFLGTAAAAALPLAWPWHARAEPVVVSLALHSRIPRYAHEQSQRDGARLGIEEAAHTYALLGREIVLIETVEGATSHLIVALGDEEQLDRLDDDALLIQATTGHNARGCADRSVFRIGDAEPGSDAVLWAPSLERYGAAQLNERFLRRFDNPMTPQAWATWFAVKVLAEAVLRARTVDPRSLAEWLAGPHARFDGHKGVPLYFNEARRLVHPRYLFDQAVDRYIELPVGGECDD